MNYSRVELIKNIKILKGLLEGTYANDEDMEYKEMTIKTLTVIINDLSSIDDNNNNKTLEQIENYNNILKEANKAYNSITQIILDNIK